MENQLFDNVQRTKMVETATGMKCVGIGESALRAVMQPARTETVAGGKRYIPLSALEALGAIFLEGVPKYGENNWKNGAGDKAYQMERWEHASRHLQLWAEGDRSENHLAKVMWFCATQIELERMEGERTNSIGSLLEMLDRRKEQASEIQEEGVVDTLKDIGTQVGTEAAMTGLRLALEKLFEFLDRNKKEAVAEEKEVPVVKKKAEVKNVEKVTKAGKPARVMSAEGKARIAEAQRKRWAKVRRMKKVEGKGKGK